MWHPTRRWSTAFYLSMIIIVFAVAVSKQNIGIVFAMLFVEIIAGTWYSISFIPFGRMIVLKCLRSTGICYPCFAIYDTIHEQTEANKRQGSQSGGSIFSTGSSNK